MVLYDDSLNKWLPVPTHFPFSFKDKWNERKELILKTIATLLQIKLWEINYIAEMKLIMREFSDNSSFIGQNSYLQTLESLHYLHREEIS